MSGTDLTILVALAAGVISFLSPCVLPLVPAYLGQLTAIAVAGSADGARPSRWLAMRHALAYVAGFGAVFTVLGITATFAAGPLADYLPALRVIGGVILIVLGLDLAGLLHISGCSERGVRSTPGRRGRWRRRPARPRSAAGMRIRALATGSAVMSSVRAAAGSPRSGSGRSSRSAGARASGSSSAGS